VKRQHPIYTEKNNCQDCYKCLKQCPVKAIKIEDASASIITERCIYCGHCVQICPVGAKKVRNDKQQLIQSLDFGKKVIACLAPSYISEFINGTNTLLIAGLKKLGFFGVSETALGAELVSFETRKWLNDQPNGVYISSCCPSAVDFICKYYPNLSSNLIPVLSPMQAHAKLVKDIYGQDTEVAFFGPCIAKKDEVDQENGLTDYALTFKDLKEWLDENVPDWDSSINEADTTFIPFPANKGNLFPVDGGMIANMKESASITDLSYMTFSGVNHIKEIVGDIPKWNIQGKLFLELLICEGGCIKGPGTIDHSSAAIKRQRILGAAGNSKKSILYKENSFELPVIGRNFDYIIPVNEPEPTEEQIQNALTATAKFTVDDELNCGGCGYDNCRDFAKAMLKGKAERTMCVSYMRKVAQDKASILLQKMPSGVVIVDENLKIIDANKKFIELLDEDTREIFDSGQNLDGADLRKLVPFYKMFTSVINTGEEMIEYYVREKGQYLHVSIITIQPYKIVCGVIQNMREPEVRKDIVLEHTKKVIRQNMEVVQKIAYLLGENASFTESMLNSIIESHDLPETENIIDKDSI
jgi:iron only hydrogenase large subunit-like protein